MATLDKLPADQRAVLQLVLQRGRTYEEIAELLSIDRAGVRDRALKAFDALGPQTRVPAERRSLIADYLLGQLPRRVADDVRKRIASSASERAWARVIAGELAPLAAGPLPEIPVEPEAASEGEAREKQEGRRPRPRAPRDRGLRTPGPPSSRRGGAFVLAAVVVAVAVVLIIVLSGGSSSSKHTSSAASLTTTTTTRASTTGTTATATTAVVAQINLLPPSSSSKAAGIAQVLRRGGATGIVIAAQGVPPNTKHDAYAVWLYNTPTDSHILGFVNPGVGSNGRLQTAGGLPANASHYKQLLVTLETQANPRSPGTIVLEGTLTGV